MIGVTHSSDQAVTIRSIKTCVDFRVLNKLPAEVFVISMTLITPLKGTNRTGFHLPFKA